jgi:hypothetical protein
MSDNKQKRMSVRDAFKGLFLGTKNKKKHASGTSTPVETEFEITGPTGFQRHVHVGVSDDGEIVGIDNMIGYIAKTDKLEIATWDKLQSQQKELSQLTEELPRQSSFKINENNSTSTSPQEKNETPKNFEKEGSFREMKEETNSVMVSSPSKDLEDKTVKMICKYKNEEERNEHNRSLLLGSPLKVSFSIEKAKEKGIIMDLMTDSTFENLEVLLLYYLTTKTFVVEITSQKIPINKYFRHFLTFSKENTWFYR